MPAYETFVATSAGDEILKHIRVLDREESWLRKQAANQRSRADDMDRKAEVLATKRRQFEFLHRTLNGDDAMPPVPTPTEPQPTSGRIIGVLGQ